MFRHWLSPPFPLASLPWCRSSAPLLSRRRPRRRLTLCVAPPSVPLPSVSSVLFLCVLVSFLLRGATERRPHRVQQLLGVPRLRDVIDPPRIVAAAVARRQREHTLDRGERRRSIAAAAPEL